MEPSRAGCTLIKTITCLAGRVTLYTRLDDLVKVASIFADTCASINIQLSTRSALQTLIGSSVTLKAISAARFAIITFDVLIRCALKANSVTPSVARLAFIADSQALARLAAFMAGGTLVVCIVSKGAFFTEAGTPFK